MFSSASPPGRVPLAWRHIAANRPRLFRSAAGIGFAVLLMLIELGFRTAFLESALEIIHQLDGDLFMINSTKYHISSKRLFSHRRVYQAEAVAGVASSRPVYVERQTALWQNPDDHHNYIVQAYAFDPDQPVFLLPDVTAHLDELRQPDTIMVDRGARRFLGMQNNAVESTFARRQIRVVGTFSIGPNFIDDGTVILSDRNFMKLFPTLVGVETERPDVDLAVIKVTPGSALSDVQQRLIRALPKDVTILTKSELLDMETAFQSTVSPVGPIFALGTLIGFGVGVLICYQILYTDIHDQLPQYATLKAMGYGNRYIIGVVLQQSILYAVTAFVPAWLLAALLYRVIGEIALLPLYMTLFLTVLGFCFTISMCALSALLAARRALAADPAEVF